MKKKILIAMVILSMMALTQVHGFGIGAQFNYAMGPNGLSAPGAALAFSPWRGFNIAGNWLLDNSVSIVGLTIDLRPLQVQLINFGLGSFNFTLDVGAYTNIKFANTTVVTGGLRVPVGLSLSLLGDFLEVYTHIAPSIGVQFSPSFDFADQWFFPVALGARVWLF